MSRTETHPFYGSSAWQKLRAKVKSKAVRCALCGKLFVKGDYIIIDHRVPRKVRPDLALVESNLQALHKLCHDSVKRKQEDGQAIPVTGPDGWPEDT